MDSVIQMKAPLIGLISPEEFLRELDLEKLCMTELQNALTDIKSSVNAGRGVDGAALREYSPGYKALKQAAGRSSITNLTVTQQLLRSMVVQPFTDGKFVGGRIVFDGPHTEDSMKVLQNAAAGRRAKGTKPKNSTFKQINQRRALQASRSAELSSRGLKQISNVAKYGRRSGGDGGGQKSNAQVASELYSKGFVGWFMLGKKQLERLERNVNAAAARVAKRIFTTKNAE